MAARHSKSLGSRRATIIASYNRTYSRRVENLCGYPSRIVSDNGELVIIETIYPTKQLRVRELSLRKSKTEAVEIEIKTV